MYSMTSIYTLHMAGADNLQILTGESAFASLSPICLLPLATLDHALDHALLLVQMTDDCRRRPKIVIDAAPDVVRHVSRLRLTSKSTLQNLPLSACQRMQYVQGLMGRETGDG